jgi:hypothetical protein
VTGLQCVRQNGPRGSGLPDRGGDDQDIARARCQAAISGPDPFASARALVTAGTGARPLAARKEAGPPVTRLRQSQDRFMTSVPCSQGSFPAQARRNNGR